MTPRQHLIEYAARHGGDLAEVMECTNVAKWAVIDGVSPSVEAFEAAIDALNWHLLRRAVDRKRSA